MRTRMYLWPWGGAMAVGIAAGCTLPPGGKGQFNASKQEEAPAAVDPVPNESGIAPKQETLAAIEDFLARTQDYRTPMKEEATKVVVPPQPMPDGQSVNPEPSPAPEKSAARDAAYANAQISVSDSVAPPPPQAVPAVESVSIRTTAPALPESQRPAKGRIANGPVELLSKEKDAADALTAALKEELGRKKDTVTQWKLQTLLAALERETESAAVSTDLPPEDARFLRAWNEALISIRNFLRNPAQGPDNALAQWVSMRDVLLTKSEPRVRHVALCRKVVTFGSYEEMAAEDFVSGRSIQTIVYADIENLRANQDAGGTFDTKLATRLEVLTAEGKSMWQREEPDVVDKCRTARRDFFVAQRVTLPPTLPAGEYVLKFSVEDKTSGMIGESSVPFGVRSRVSVANGQ